MLKDVLRILNAWAPEIGRQRRRTQSVHHFSPITVVGSGGQLPINHDPSYKELVLP
jgi:hypothetical protein